CAFTHRVQRGSRSLPPDRPPVSGGRDRATRRRMGGGGHRAQGSSAQGRRTGHAVPHRARGIRRAGPRFRLQRHRRRGKRLLWPRDQGLFAPVGHRRELSHLLRFGRAEEEVAAAHGLGRDDHGDRDDRTRHRVRPSGHAHHGQEGRQPLRHQRIEDLHHQRP
ncbi:hypothetical protein OY671_011387, partial [Metschnikowia pulcherrima]